MKLTCTWLALLAVAGLDALAAPRATNPATTGRVLIIGPSSMPIGGGQATLTIGALHLADGVFRGAYGMNVSPYFFKNEKGRLAIAVSDESLANISQGKTATVIGTAITSGDKGRSRHIDAIATPADYEHGTLKLWFMAGDRKMIFEPAYHFATPGTAAVRATGPDTNLAFHVPRRVPVSHRDALATAVKIPAAPEIHYAHKK